MTASELNDERVSKHFIYETLYCPMRSSNATHFSSPFQQGPTDDDLYCYRLYNLCQALYHCVFAFDLFYIFSYNLYVAELCESSILRYTVKNLRLFWV